MTGDLGMALDIADQPIGALRKHFFVYIMASKKVGVLYVGVTSGLPARVWQHREAVIEGFTKNTSCAASSILKNNQMPSWRSRARNN